MDFIQTSIQPQLSTQTYKNRKLRFTPLDFFFFVIFKKRYLLKFRLFPTLTKCTGFQTRNTRNFVRNQSTSFDDIIPANEKNCRMFATLKLYTRNVALIVTKKWLRFTIIVQNGCAFISTVFFSLIFFVMHQRIHFYCGLCKVNTFFF